MKFSAILAVIAISAAVAARAQTLASPAPAQPPAVAPAVSPALGGAPSAEALALARTLVQESGVGGQAAMNGMVVPPPGYLASLGVTDPRQAAVVAHDAVMPDLGDHADALTDIQVKSYATLLSVPEMKAAIAFFGSPAGKNYVKIRDSRVQDEMSKASALIAKLEPEITAQVSAVARAHGWPGG
jgi:hypothetical protein